MTTTTVARVTVRGGWVATKWLARLESADRPRMATVRVRRMMASRSCAVGAVQVVAMLKRRSPSWPR